MEILMLEDFLQKKVSNRADRELILSLLKKYDVTKVIVSPTLKTSEKPIAIPSNRTHEGFVKLKIRNDFMTAIYEKNSEFIEVVKNLGMKWNPNFGWTITENERLGIIEDICAEIGNTLLNAGFAVQFDSKELLRKAVSADYKPMHKNWIGFSEITKKFIITWRKNQNLYEQAMTLPSAKYENHGVSIPEKFFFEVWDFSEKYGCKFSETAQKKLDSFILKRVKGIQVGNIYGKDLGLMKCRKLPKNYKSWEEYRDFLLETYPDESKKHIFEKRFATQLKNNYVARQQCRQLILNDYENNLPVDNSEDPREKTIAKWRKLL